MGDSPNPVATPASERGALTSRGGTLSVVIVISVALFVLTHFVNAAYQRERAALAEHWLKTGDTDFAAGNAASAVDSYRAALTYDSTNPDTTLKLAEALARAGQQRQATSYLLTLLQEEPGNGPVNLALARLATKEQDSSDAVRYYHGAIYGGWSGQGQAMRRQARLELVDFLLNHNAVTNARSELIGLTADLPRDPAVIADVADRFVRAGDDENALRLYRDVIGLRKATPAIWSAAGMSAFRLADYRVAEEYLARAKGAGDNSVAASLDTARAVLELDPFARGLPTSRRIERLRRVLDIAAARAEVCKPPQPSTSISPAAAQMVDQLDTEKEASLLRQQLSSSRELDPDVTDAVMRFVLRVEQSGGQCPAASSQDSAATLIARNRQAEER